MSALNSLTNVGFNSNDAGILGQLERGVVTLAQTTPGSGLGTISFDLLGFRSIDGFNCCTDTFSFSANGSTIFTGVFPLGSGSGGDSFTGPAGTTVTGSGSSRTITIPIALLAGVNSFDFTYGNLQGFGDEAWGLDNVRITAQVGAVVPEPASWALMIAGFGLLGGRVRRRSAKVAFG